MSTAISSTLIWYMSIYKTESDLGSISLAYSQASEFRLFVGLQSMAKDTKEVFWVLQIVF